MDSEGFATEANTFILWWDQFDSAPVFDSIKMGLVWFTQLSLKGSCVVVQWKEIFDFPSLIYICGVNTISASTLRTSMLANLTVHVFILGYFEELFMVLFHINWVSATPTNHK